MSNERNDCHLDKALNDSFLRNLAICDEKDLNFRLWARDSGVFTGKKEGAMLDWLDLPPSMMEALPALEKMAQAFNSEWSHFVLIGMGGSSLSVQVFQSILKPESHDRFYVLDTIHPDAIARLSAKLDLKKTLFIVASKSGSTLEADLLYRHFFSLLSEQGLTAPYRHFLVITDPQSPLHEEAKTLGIPVVLGRVGVGGRFSALSVFGLLPACLLGIDARRLLSLAIAMAQDCGPSMSAHQHPAMRLAAFLVACLKDGRDKIFIHLSPSLKPLGLWLEQLIAESLGKAGSGIVPIVDPCHLASSSEDQAQLLINLGGEERLTSTPCFSITIADTYEIGALMFCCQMAVSLSAALIKINPFDQPDVEESKRLAKTMLSEQSKTAKNLPITVNNLSFNNAIEEFIKKIKNHDYCAVLSYLDETAAVKQLLHHLKLTLAKKTSAVMLQNGPRYLHSTGQLFKGGKNNGNFIILTGPYDKSYKTSDSIEIKDIHMSQAQGDILALKNADRRLIWIHLDDLDRELRELNDAVSHL